MPTLPPPVADVPAAFVATVQAAFAQRPGQRFVLLLSGGSTARDCYEALAAAAHASDPDDNSHAGSNGIDWSLVDLYMGDERLVPPDDDDANQRLVHEALVDHVAAGSFTPMPTQGAPEDCAQAYQEVMARVVAGPGIDVIHLGLGPDGHTASLFPDASTLSLGPDVLVASADDPHGRNPHPRLTVTLPLIGAARCAVFTVAGDSKRDAVAALRRGDDIPAARVQAERIVWLLDAAAADVAP
jgi:6-phosphogluconolactonase